MFLPKLVALIVLSSAALTAAAARQDQPMSAATPAPAQAAPALPATAPSATAQPPGAQPVPAQAATAQQTAAQPATAVSTTAPQTSTPQTSTPGQPVAPGQHRTAQPFSTPATVSATTPATAPTLPPSATQGQPVQQPLPASSSQYRPAQSASMPAAQPLAATTPPASGTPSTPSPASAPATRYASPAATPSAVTPSTAILPASPVVAAALSASRADDDNFLLLREAARQDDANAAATYAARLPNYVIPSYVDYYRLKPRLREASADEVRAFLERWKGSAIADRMRNDWLLELGRARDWANFDQQLPLFVLNDDTQVKCYALVSRALKGERVAADARALLTNPPGYGEACALLVSTLATAGQFDRNDLLAQLRLAGEMHATGPARRTAALLGGSETFAAQAVDLPAIAMARGIGSSAIDHEIYLVAVGRMARTTLRLAKVALEKNAPRLSAQEQATGWASIALAASMTLSPDAYAYWRRSGGAPLSLDQQQWKTRIALRQGDWKMVRDTIETMPASLRADPTWTYWMARALVAESPANRERAHALYQRIADINSFYGQLAMEELGLPLAIPPTGPPLAAAEIAPMAANPGLRRALKFFSLRLRFEGTREWNWELRKFGERELIAAAEFARQNEILDRMVNTSERTRTEFDYTQRFPSPHNDILQPTAQSLGLDRAWVYGLIRQESRFITDARSGVGASGLMQVMPSTGEYVAKKIGLTDFVHTMLTDLRTNILVGANYMNMVLANADGSQPLASAAYNAGPGRARTWRGTLNGPMEGAIFAESIPYPETRTYVKNVLANATNYAALFEKKPQSLKARLGVVTPSGPRANQLP